MTREEEIKQQMVRFIKEEISVCRLDGSFCREEAKGILKEVCYHCHYRTRIGTSYLFKRREEARKYLLENYPEDFLELLL